MERIPPARGHIALLPQLRQRRNSCSQICVERPYRHLPIDGQRQAVWTHDKKAETTFIGCGLGLLAKSSESDQYAVFIGWQVLTCHPVELYSTRIASSRPVS